ncbi:MAG: hypothetical protein HEQ26_02785 [Dolichospermum sp. DL01]|jgi:hypothetical protein|nr:MAG: hypothetical protein HEQ26_02785 [Dolichospermum sp. DL01]
MPKLAEMRSLLQSKYIIVPVRSLRYHHIAVDSLNAKPPPIILTDNGEIVTILISSSQLRHAAAIYHASVPTPRKSFKTSFWL